MKKKYNWGIIGLGMIADKFAKGLTSVPGAKLFAVASRDLKKADAFAKKYNVPYAYGTYEEITENKEIDIIYIATPHTLHCENTLMCLNKKIPVLCEKPFAMNLKEVKRMVGVSREKKVFLMEALWTAFLPSIKKVKEAIASGMIGDVHLLRADFGFQAPRDPENRIFNMALGGGSLLDVGIYPAYLAMEILGKPQQIKALSSTGPTGIDQHCGFVFKYQSGQIASLYSSVMAWTAIDAMITGEKGSIHIYDKFFMPSKVVYVSSEGKRKDMTPEYIGNGYNYEAMEAMACLEKGLFESDRMNHDKSLALMEILDGIRLECGIRYPGYDDV